jgi:hypothetical protein
VKTEGKVSKTPITNLIIMKIAIISHARWGKDTLAEFLLI